MVWYCIVLTRFFYLSRMTKLNLVSGLRTIPYASWGPVLCLPYLPLQCNTYLRQRRGDQPISMKKHHISRASRDPLPKFTLANRTSTITVDWQTSLSALRTSEWQTRSSTVESGGGCSWRRTSFALPRLRSNGKQQWPTRWENHGKNNGETPQKWWGSSGHINDQQMGKPLTTMGKQRSRQQLPLQGKQQPSIPTNREATSDTIGNSGWHQWGSKGHRNSHHHR